MSQDEHPHTPMFGILLLFLGVVFLLQTLGFLPWELWRSMWRFWPVLIIVAGINLVLRHRSPWLVGLIVLAILLTCLGLAIWQYGPLPPVGHESI
ncbi:MAG: DUF5668 domain-containing protein [Dehalococcoidales bacterium]|nr:DUF5668 domain-containing protein [Dehalococcoidales bacterium]